MMTDDAKQVIVGELTIRNNSAGKKNHGHKKEATAFGTEFFSRFYFAIFLRLASSFSLG